MFEWDETKSAANLKARGFDFAFAARIFDGPSLELDDARADYGERRSQAIGRTGRAVLFMPSTGERGTWRGDARRIISARLANRRERDIYDTVFGGPGAP